MHRRRRTPRRRPPRSAPAGSAASTSGNDTKNGLSGPNLTVGTFVSPALALGLRATSTTIWIDNGGSGLRVNNLFVGPVLQRWVTPSLFTTVGLGLAMIETAVDGAGDSTTGVGLDARLGWEVSPGAQSGWHVAIEVAPAFYEINGNPLRVTSIGFQIGWQHH